MFRPDRVTIRWAMGMLALFVAWGMVRFPSGSGDDLSSSYVGCRLLATGQGGHLYQHDPHNFAEIGPDDAWQETADTAGFDGDLHPYVQTPLWAWSLQPLCMRTSFVPFQRMFSTLEVVCFGVAIWLIAWYWAPRMLVPWAMGILLVGLWFSVPFQYAMSLTQTHILFFAMTVGALILAERRRPGWAGLLLALAAAVKITPAVLAIYWLLTRRWKAAAGLAGWSAAIFGLTVLAVGRGLTGTYLQDLHRISRVLLLAENNQSFVAWWSGWAYPAAAATKIDILPLPSVMRLASAALLIGLTVVGGLIDRRREGPPLGAMMAVVAATVFAPIAWTHYSIVLVGPLMVLWQENGLLRSWWVRGAMVAIATLNFLPLAADVSNWRIGRFALVRSEFYAGVLCLVVLGWVEMMARRRCLTA